METHANASAGLSLREAIQQAKMKGANLDESHRVAFEYVFAGAWRIRTLGELADPDRINMRALKQMRTISRIEDAAVLARELLTAHGYSAAHLQD